MGVSLSKMVFLTTKSHQWFSLCPPCYLQSIQGIPEAPSPEEGRCFRGIRERWPLLFAKDLSPSCRFLDLFRWFAESLIYWFSAVWGRLFDGFVQCFTKVSGQLCRSFQVCHGRLHKVVDSGHMVQRETITDFHRLFAKTSVCLSNVGWSHHF